MRDRRHRAAFFITLLVCFLALLSNGCTKKEQPAETNSIGNATDRNPAKPEADVLREAFQEELQQYKRHEDQAQALLKVGESPITAKLDKPELAAWTTVASMILNLDETITKE